MKTLIRFLTLLSSALFLLVACDQHPLSPDENNDTNMPIDGITKSGNITFLRFNADDTVLSKPIIVTKLISAENGGELIATYNWGRENGCSGDEKYASFALEGGTDEIPRRAKSKIYVSLYIPPGALDEDTELSLTLNAGTIGGEVDMVFSPHGTIFNTPAILNVKALRLDLGGLCEEEIDIYYDNQEKGCWDTMESSFVKANLKGGFIIVKNALLPHFSRYAMAYGW